MKFTTFTTTAAALFAGVAVAAPASATAATPTGDVLVPTQSSVPIFQEFQELEKDVEKIVQDVRSVVPLVSGNATYPQDLRQLISAISTTANDVEGLVRDIGQDLRGIFTGGRN
ncbi:hypothetical protein KGF57_004759 [Candida theae]|uniref:Uncharacterized protein n=1 Tax=Candida theae TaxID=1198502 RepID=A0AAD5BAX6_9ASCO|nr:uncharacterized protein KGF57_004759 [Candida theae]KAI5949161.1 hypothetical protein KGF57_004759 [Candida theae]